MSVTVYPPRLKTALDALYYVTATFIFVYLFNYFISGLGGPTVLAVTMVPVCYILFILGALRDNDLYPKLGVMPNIAIGAVQIGLALMVLYYIRTEFYDIRTVRAGFWNTADLWMGGIMALLVLEYTRKRHFVILLLNIVLILYAVYGNIVPGTFHHPGMSWERIVTASSLETTTGVYSNLPQLALTLIGSFILVLAALRAFGGVDSILLGASLISAKSPYALPQAAVIGSLGVATVSGSGAANAAATGSATIPAMIQSGLPRSTAAAIEAASSLGGQLMPPIMGISAFLMADFLGVSYFDVVARGYAPAVIYFVALIVSVYLLSVSFRPKGEVTLPGGVFTAADAINIAVFALVVFGLIALMAITNMAAMIAALYVFCTVAPVMFALDAYRRYRAGEWRTFRQVTAPLVRMVDAFSSMTADLTLLLAALSIMTGVFVITGIPTKVGALLLEAAGVNVFAMAVIAFLFGAIVGTGLPPAPTYILTALVIAPPMIKAGIDPWVVHFYAFFLAVWGELTPPTSVVAAVTAKIADASFLGTLGRAIVLCLSLFTLMAGVFVRPELVKEPGVDQLAAMFLILTATLGIVFAVQARFGKARRADLITRGLLLAVSLFALFCPDDMIAAIACVPILLIIGGWFFYQRPRQIREVRALG